MRAAVVTEPGGPEVFAIQEIEDPVAGPEDALVDVHATALNRADVLQRMGRYPGPPGTRDDVPGLEMAGIVAEVGERVTAVRPGDRVMALLGGGGYAERVAVHERLLMTAPECLDLTGAAAIPEVFLTAFDALFLRCGLRPGERVLVHACGSGVGTAAIQMAAAAGCRTIGTASGDKLDRAAALGLEVGLDRNAGPFADAVREATDGRGVDVILDVVGAPYWDQNLAALAPKGRVVIVGTMGGRKVEADLSALMRKRATVHGTVLRARPLEEKATLTQAFTRRVLPSIAAGRIRPIVDRVYPIEEVAEAHRRIEANASFGKIVLRLR